MKKRILAWTMSFLLILAGCSALDGLNVETLKGWTFQYNRGTEDYSLFFGLLDKSGQYISAAADLDIRIVNEAGEEVYSGTASVTKEDFAMYTSEAAGERYLAEIRIPKEDIAPGKSTDGTVYLTVYKENVFRFDEVNCSALFCLPVADVELVAEELPKEITVRGYDGSVESVVEIEEVLYAYETELSPTLGITVSGTKLSGRAKTGFDMIAYKIYDSAGCVVESANLMLQGVAAGDKFKDDSIYLYDVIPGETYTITFAEYEWLP